MDREGAEETEARAPRHWRPKECVGDEALEAHAGGNKHSKVCMLCRDRVGAEEPEACADVRNLKKHLCFAWSVWAAKNRRPAQA